MEIETQYTPCPLTEELIYENNSPRMSWLLTLKEWIPKTTPIVTKSANISCRLYTRLGYQDCPIFV